MREKMSGVYKITNTANNKVYIGQGGDVHHRKISHFSKLNRGVHWNKHLQRSFNKHGESSFVFEVIAEGSSSYILELEVTLIKSYRGQLGRRNVYNITDGGEGGGGVSPSSKTRNKISEKLKGIIRTQKTREKISNSTRGEKHHFFGKTHTEETRKKMSDRRKELNHGETPVRKINPNTGESIATYRNMQDARKSCGLKSYTTISMCCTGKRKTAGGFKWEYVQ